MAPPLPIAALTVALTALLHAQEGPQGAAGAAGAAEAEEAENRLASETSPYLLQHARNPVDWYPWGPAALERARIEDKPIFLSVGYSACHWCHVMERESFEDEAIARLLNEHFVCVKVDREERPDVDAIYMRSVELMTGRAGWPLSVFLTPELVPFFGGTYFPPEKRPGLPGFRALVEELARIWRRDRASVERAGAQLLERLRDEAAARTGGDVDPRWLDELDAALAASFDATWGGFGGAPKFPRTTELALCLSRWARTGDARALRMATHTLDRMLAGGIYDRLGGGFHRYSTDARWTIPHFEKMLYDNALLVPVLLDAYRATGRERYAHGARATCDWALREMVTAEGGFASSQDADSEGEEGRFFVWTPAELVEALGERHGRWAAAAWGVTEAGNFEHGRSALWRPRPLTEVAAELGVEPDELERALDAARPRLFERRAARPRPATDDKVLPAWNGLMITALARADQVLDEPRYRAAARRAAEFVLGSMRRDSGRLYAAARAGRAHLEAYLDDYALLIQGLLDLYETDFDERWIREARALDLVLAGHFEDAEEGGFFTTADDHEALLVRLKSPHDGALPSGNGVHALNLYRLAELTGAAAYRERADRTLQAFGGAVAVAPRGYGALCAALDFAAAPPRQVVIAGADGDPRVDAFLRAVRDRLRPAVAVARARPGADVELLPVLEGRVGAEPRAYVCRELTCGRPAETLEELAAQLDGR